MFSCRIIVLVVFALLGVVGHPPADGTRGQTSAVEGHHSDGSSCPDSGPDGHACPPGCPCTCCPGHRAAPALLTGPTSARPTSSNELCAGPPDAPLAEGIPRGVFHPPRV